MAQETADYPVIPADRADDLHNLEQAEEADLVLFMAGNQFMVMRELLQAFQQAHPRIEKIFYETLPPGLELAQIIAGGARFRDQVIKVRPDVYSSVSAASMELLVEKKLLRREDYFLYLHNRLVLMVAAGNPAAVRSVVDLGRDKIRISQPDRRYEHIADHIIEMYRQAGGDELVRRIMETKRAEGTTILTVVHHRETPLRLAKGTVDVGPVWATEVEHARRSGLAVEMVDPGPELDQRQRINYYIGLLEGAPHRENGKLFMDFIASPPAQAIFAAHGFVPHFPIG